MRIATGSPLTNGTFFSIITSMKASRVSRFEGQNAEPNEIWDSDVSMVEIIYVETSTHIEQRALSMRLYDMVHEACDFTEVWRLGFFASNSLCARSRGRSGPIAQTCR